MKTNKLNQLILTILIAGICLNAVLLPLSGISIALPSIVATLMAVSVMGLFALIGKLVLWRLANDETRIAGVLQALSRSIVTICVASIAMMLLTPTMLVTNYITMSTQWPLQDAAFAYLDEAMGFNWLAVLAWTNERPWISWITTTSYASSLYQTMAVILVLGAIGAADRLREFIALFAVTGTLVTLFSMFVPTMGPYIYYAPPPEMFTLMSENAGRLHVEHLTKLRAGAFEVLDLKHGVGLVNYPSFHTVLAIIVPFAFRDIRVLFWPLVALNAIVIFSTLPEGGHYLIDLIGGALVAVAGIGLVKGLSGAASREQSIAAATENSDIAIDGRLLKP